MMALSVVYTSSLRLSLSVSLRLPRALCNARRLFVCPSVCLSVCLLATLRKNHRTDVHENFTTDVGLSVVKEGLIKVIRLRMRIQVFL